MGVVCDHIRSGVLCVSGICPALRFSWIEIKGPPGHEPPGKETVFGRISCPTTAQLTVGLQASVFGLQTRLRGGESKKSGLPLADSEAISQDAVSLFSPAHLPLQTAAACHGVAHGTRCATNTCRHVN